MHIRLCTDIEIQPKKIYVSRPVPLHHEEEAKNVVDQLICEGIIKAVQEETCDWINPTFFMSKGKLRLVTDFTHLKFIKRPVHPFPSAK